MTSQTTPTQTAIRRARRIAAVSALTVAALAVPAASASAYTYTLAKGFVSSVTAEPTPSSGARSTLELSAQTDPAGVLVALLLPAIQKAGEPAPR